MKNTERRMSRRVKRTVKRGGSPPKKIKTYIYLKNVFNSRKGKVQPIQDNLVNLEPPQQSEVVKKSLNSLRKGGRKTKKNRKNKKV